MNRRHVTTATCALAALTLAGCSGNDPDGDLTWEDSPLAQKFEEFYDAEKTQADYDLESAERERAEQEIIAQCMADEGFEYIPVDYSGGVTYVSGEDWGSEEWTQQYGYGITTDPWADEEPVSGDEDAEWLDPNAEYYESMSDSEREAYDIALNGEQTEIGEGEWVEDDEGYYDDSDYNWEDGGCWGKANHEVYQDENSMWEDPAFTEMMEAYEGVYEKVQTDPRMADINAEWAQCMADAGLTGLAAPDDTYTAIVDEYDLIMRKVEDEIDLDGIDWDNVPDDYDPWQEYMEGAGLVELREREIAMAVADLACQEESNVESRRLSIQFEYEEEFLAEWEAELDALIATHGQNS